MISGRFPRTSKSFPELAAFTADPKQETGAEGEIGDGGQAGQRKCGQYGRRRGNYNLITT